MNTRALTLILICFGMLSCGPAKKPVSKPATPAAEPPPQTLTPEEPQAPAPVAIPPQPKNSAGPLLTAPKNPAPPIQPAPRPPIVIKIPGLKAPIIFKPAPPAQATLTVKDELDPKCYQHKRSGMPEVQARKRTVIATFPFSDRVYAKNHRVLILAQKQLTLAGAYSFLASQGYKTIGLISAGLFSRDVVGSPDTQNLVIPQSFSKPGALPIQDDFTQVKPRERPCLIYDPSAARLAVESDTSENRSKWLSSPALEVVCGGPTLIQYGFNVSALTQSTEGFKNRVGNSEPLPRSALCIDWRGDLKLIAVDSAEEELTQVRCGTTVSDLGTTLLREHCWAGFAGPEGGASALWAEGAPGQRRMLDGASREAIPVWLAVVEAH